ncbi:MAG: multifunctional CCA tRNA nucleotidyl transferase/2'3'-cyclic phosphodiesterase/2'nucleotidase/phosphatase [Rhodoferax sp.]|nr:multifunctional CCA tRNA nucleotidyl transferase/2'3'-cyclic phosphodiesterase/2'nucleotidase/phosphatase [Rhodoferax sp.]
MQIYLVGGAVRDTLLGLSVKDRDWVVVGSTPQQMVDQGFLPVGRDFPVFLHPATHEEYALARTERKTGPGYRGFEIVATSGVTLEQDLARRDLTMNAIAVAKQQVRADGSFDPAQVVLCDPFHGQRDLRAKVLRHVTDAFREDPVRILRVARFAARFSDFSVAFETTALMQEMVARGEANALVAERVWQELAMGLMESHAARMVAVLQDSGAWANILPELDLAPASTALRQLAATLDTAGARGATLEIRFACLCLCATPAHTPANAALAAIRSLCQRLRIPSGCRDLALLLVRELDSILASLALHPTGVVDLLERCDAFRKPARFIELLGAAACATQAGSISATAGTLPAAVFLQTALAATQAAPTAVVAAQAHADGIDGRQIGDRVRAARIAAVAAGR